MGLAKVLRALNQENEWEMRRNHSPGEQKVWALSPIPLPLSEAGRKKGRLLVALNLMQGQAKRRWEWTVCDSGRWNCTGLYQEQRKSFTLPREETGPEATRIFHLNLEGLLYLEAYMVEKIPCLIFLVISGEP